MSANTQLLQVLKGFAAATLVGYTGLYVVKSLIKHKKQLEYSRSR